MPTTEQVRAIFASFEEGNAPSFFQHVVDDVDWEVKGRHLYTNNTHGSFIELTRSPLYPAAGTFCPIAGRYKSKAEFHEGTKSLSSTWASPLKLQVRNVICDGHQAVVEMRAIDTECLNGLPFTNEYAWVCEFNDENRIIRIRAYMDTDLVCRAIRENQE
ncbi:nuclear transport factor 2 family protein [Aspergillus melleus]|uniref:nuclear transport factor 2 family protein n=1 Tax=Aspergillus melleus TaxID=138277 RepID=UPI001E8CB7CE|nr:uncharacterized protein LDX57_007922 [Aspergillus melleus]KAH8430253.1 hypothetical protein LDX57_007922 [Aspergillus melleus]